MRQRLLFVAVGLVLWTGAIAARLYDLQVAKHDHYRDRAARQQQRVVELDGPRGTIYDRRGRELAVSVAVESAYAVPRKVVDAEKTAAAIAKVVGGDRRDIARRLAVDREFVWIARKLDRPVAAQLRALDLPGLYFLEETKRYYPMRSLAAHVLGYVGTDDEGLAGVEALYDDAIKGVAVRRTVLKDARHGTALDPELSFADAQPGSDLHLTVDASIQYFAEQALAHAVEKFRAKRGSIVVLDPRTGEVLALASNPTFDPNTFARFPESSWRDRALMDAYEPGSTFKIVTAAAALEANLVDPTDVIDCQMGSITLAGTRINDHKPFGLLTFAEVLAKSSNVGAIKTGLKVGDQRLYAMIRALGFGAATGIDLPGESAGILRPVERWQPLSKAYISFGQEISVTPLQLTTAVAAVANGGRLLKPYVVAGISGAGGEMRRRVRPTVVSQPISAATVRSLERMLEGVVAEGTAKKAAIPGFAVAGKTGTAQKAGPGGGYLHNRFVASFVGFAPARDPRLVAVVVIDEPTPPFYHGGDVAAPAFSEMIGPSLLYLGVRPEREPLERWPGEPAPPVGATPVPTVPGMVLASAVTAPAPATSDDDTSEGVPAEGMTAPAEAAPQAPPAVAAPAVAAPAAAPVASAPATARPTPAIVVTRPLAGGAQR